MRGPNTDQNSFIQGILGGTHSGVAVALNVADTKLCDQRVARHLPCRLSALAATIGGAEPPEANPELARGKDSSESV